MRIDLITNAMSINLGHLIDAGDSPIDIFIPSDICNEIRDNHLKGKFSSYPIFKNDDCFDIECDVDPQMGCIFWGEKQEWSCSLTNLIMPMALRMKEEYDVMLASTKEVEQQLLINECHCGATYECYHSLYDLYIEHLIIDTDKLTIEMILGS